MVEASERGKSIGIINSGHIAQPGTGVFVASVPRRAMREQIAEQVIRSGADVIMAGGETLLLPEGVVGRHGVAGIRKDGSNLIEIASELGYTIVYTRDELMAVPNDVDKLLGIFSAEDMFNDLTEEALNEAKLPLYEPQAPTSAEMTEVALRVLKNKGKEFLLVVEEEGSDNFGNVNNARGMLEALRRADAAIGVAIDYMSDNPNTLIVTAADSDAGGMKVWMPDLLDPERPLPAVLHNGAPLDGRDGTGSKPFRAAPDRFGTRLPFGIAWAAREDVEGGVIARAHGLNAESLPRNVDNTDIYRLMYATLFGSWLPAER
jgi:alkaline phosphatase